MAYTEVSAQTIDSYSSDLNQINSTGTGMTRTAFDEGSDGLVRVGKLYHTFALENRVSPTIRDTNTMRKKKHMGNMTNISTVQQRESYLL